MLIAIEGIDGAGKRTLTDKLRNLFAADGKSVAMLAFPRYGRSVTADIASEALHGEHGEVIMDRYVASNAAYTAARLHQDAAGPAVQWIHALEYQRLGLPAPDWQVLLAVPAELAGRRARSRAESDPGRARDSYERDDGLQQRTGAVYAELAAAGWGGRWLSVDAGVDPGRLAADLAAN